MKKDVQIGVRMPTWLRDELRSLAENDDRSLSSYIVRVLEQHVERRAAAKRERSK